MPGTDLGTAYVQIIPSAKGIKGSITKMLNGEAGTAGASAGKSIAGSMKSAIVKAGIGTAIAMGLKKSLSEGGALQQSYFGGLDTLYGDAADKAREYARAAVQAGVSQNSFAEQAVSFGAALRQAYGGDTSKSLEAANKAILDMTDNAAKMGTPLESIQDAYQGFAKQNYTMLDNLKLGYGGTKSEMERLLADAEKLTGQKYDIENLGDVYDAIHAIQGDLGLTGVAAEEAADTFTGSMGAMKAAYDNLMGNLMIGENVGPAMQDLVTTTSNFLLGNLIPAVGQIFKSLPEAASAFMETGMPILIENGRKMIDFLMQGTKSQLPVLITNLMTTLTGLSGKLRTGFGQFVNVGLQLIKNIADGIIRNIPVFIQTVPTIISNLAGLINDNAPKIISTGMNIIANLAKGLVKAIPVLVSNLPQIVNAIFDVLEAVNWVMLGGTIVKGIAKGLKAAASGVKSAAKKIWDSTVSPVKGATSKINAAVKSIKSHLSFSGLSSKVSSTFNKIKSKITEPISKAKEKVKDAVNKIKGLFPLSVGRIFSGLKLPHFSVSGGSAPYGIGGKGSLPHFSVSWYKKAMENPYLFDQATLIGAGEAGDEMLYGRKALMRDISEAVSGKNGQQVTNTFYFTVNGAEDPEDWARRTIRQLKIEMRMA